MTAIDVWVSGIVIGIGIGFIASLLVMAGLKGLKAFGRALMGIGVVLALTVPLSAQWRYVSTAAEVTVGASAVDLFVDADVEAGNGHPAATLATCSLTGANIRVSYSGTDPTTSLGEILVPGVYTVIGTDVMRLARGIRDDSTSATWNCILHGN